MKNTKKFYLLTFLPLLCACNGGTTPTSSTTQSPSSTQTSVVPTSVTSQTTSQTSSITTTSVTSVVPTSATSQTTSQTSSITTTSETSVEPLQEKTLTISMVSPDFNFTAGTSFDSEGSSAQAEKLLKYLNSSNEDNVFSQINVVNCNANTDGLKNIVHFIIGSSKSEGSITFYSNYNLKSVEFDVRAYYKTYVVKEVEYANIDVSTFIINETKHPLPETTVAPTELQTYKVDFSSNVKSFTISNEDGRVFVDKIKLTYIIG